MSTSSEKALSLTRLYEWSAGYRELASLGGLTRGCHRTLIKTQDYLDVFARFKQKENIEAVERMLTSHTELELFERSQLGTVIDRLPFSKHR